MEGGHVKDDPDQLGIDWPEGAHTGPLVPEATPPRPRARWDCSSPGAYCGNLACTSNMAGLHVTEDGTIVIGRGGGGRGGERGVVVLADAGDAQLSGEGGLFEAAAAMCVKLADDIVEQHGTVCGVELGRRLAGTGQTLEQSEVGRALGMTRQRAQQIERSGLRSMRTKLLRVGIGPADVEEEPDVMDALRGRR